MAAFQSTSDYCISTGGKIVCEIHLLISIAAAELISSLRLQLDIYIYISLPDGLKGVRMCPIRLLNRRRPHP
ncbi:hypothetical protein V1478_001683 [Vespula squamosa]|uniref:Uncharacterized protein n=1 Tax=Vespula squamosa TaxID=30214 RepID=A0ABD2BXU5_VESSQ